MKIAPRILAFAVMAAGVSAYPQAPNQSPWTVNVPFNFTMRHTNLEAGKYTVHQAGKIVYLTSRSGKTANVLTNEAYASKPAEHSSLVFKLSDGEYALAQVKSQGSNTELNAVSGKHVRKPIAASVTARMTGPETVEVASVGTR